MNREIKFRAWDGKTMYLPDMSTEDDFYITCDGEIKYQKETGYERHLGNYHRKNWTVMQYTGLNDKNGVEIYEGDIVDIVRNKQKNKNITHDTGVHKIVWINGGLFVEGYSNDLGWQCENFDVEVIGNIHENKELLAVR